MIDRNYLKNVICEISNCSSVLSGCKKIQNIYGIPYYILYNFTKSCLPEEKNLLLIIKYLNLDLNKLFVI